MKSVILTALIGMMLLCACKSEKEKLIDQIKSNEKTLKSDTTGVMHYEKAEEMVKQYEDYVARFPDDSLSAKFLFKAADVSAHSHNIAHAIELYKDLIQKYPQSKLVPQSWFFIGFLNENELKNINEARKAYTTLIEKFPDYEQIKTVQWLLNNLGRSDAEIVRQFEAAQQQADSAKVNN